MHRGIWGKEKSYLVIPKIIAFRTLFEGASKDSGIRSDRCDKVSNLTCEIRFTVRGRFKSFKGSNLSYPSDHDTDHRQINKCLGCLWQ